MRDYILKIIYIASHALKRTYAEKPQKTPICDDAYRKIAPRKKYINTKWSYTTIMRYCDHAILRYRDIAIEQQSDFTKE